MPESAALAGMLKAEQEDKEEEDLKDLIGKMELDEAAAAVAFREAIAQLPGVLYEAAQTAKAAEEAAAKAAKAVEEAKQRREQEKQRREQEESMDHAWSVLEDRLGLQKDDGATMESLRETIAALRAAELAAKSAAAEGEPPQ